MADVKINWDVLNDNFKRNRKSLEVFCVPILLYNLFGGPLDNISLLGISTNGSGLTRAYLILPVIYLMLAYLTYRYWQSFVQAKKDMKSNVMAQLHNIYALETAQARLESKRGANRGSRYVIENPAVIRLMSSGNNLLERVELTGQELNKIKLRIHKYLVTKNEGIGLEIYVPLYLAAVTAISIPINWLASLSWLWV